ncbi:MAG: VWA domain-containing protein, partial [Candidatus Tectomicrobia bacterium]|nr:VWA domain-containing protein [Candidatus Tectomicrobia bacterium]
MSPFLWKTSAGLFRSSVTWEYTFPILLIAAIAVGFAVLIGLQWHDLRSRVGSGVRWGLCLLRGGIYVLILIILLNPTLVIQKVLRLLPTLAVVMDTSGSMALSDSASATDATRLNQTLDYLRSGSPSPLDTLAKNYQVKLYQFDETARPLSPQALEQLQSSGQSTDISGSLTALLEENRSSPPVGVLLLSDGAHHAPDSEMAYLRQADIPIVAVGLGNPDTYRDIRVASVQAPSLTFLHYPVTIQTTLQVWGYKGEKIPVVLKRAGRVVATQTVQVTNPDGTHQVAFEILPEDIGEFTYTVSVAPRLGEALTENNAKTFPLSVARDKIRVLLVCGSPTWNYRFLRQALKQDPSVDLISFVILRTPTDVVNVPESQLSLIPFPTRRLFTQELQNFDLIIFENFSFQFYFPWYYLENVRNYVREGGAFAMIGGRLAFAQGGYAGTPI